MPKKKLYKTNEQLSAISEPPIGYEKGRIVFSTLETQNDIQLKYIV